MLVAWVCFRKDQRTVENHDVQSFHCGLIISSIFLFLSPLKLRYSHLLALRWYKKWCRSLQCDDSKRAPLWNRAADHRDGPGLLCQMGTAWWWKHQLAQHTLWQTNSLLLNMAIEIVNCPIKQYWTWWCSIVFCMLTRGYFQPNQGHFWALIATKTPDFSPTDLTQWTHLLKPPQKPHLILSISLTSQACAALLGQIVPQASRAKCTMAGQSPTIYFADFRSLQFNKKPSHASSVEIIPCNPGWLRTGFPVLGLLESPIYKGWIFIPQLIINQQGFSSHCSCSWGHLKIYYWQNGRIHQPEHN